MVLTAEPSLQTHTPSGLHVPFNCCANTWIPVGGLRQMKTVRGEPRYGRLCCWQNPGATNLHLQYLYMSLEQSWQYLSSLKSTPALATVLSRDDRGHVFFCFSMHLVGPQLRAKSCWEV